MDNPGKTKSGDTKIIAAIDIGSNLIRLSVAEVLPDGSIEILEQLQRATRLGQDTFRRGRLGNQAIRTAVAILRDYRKLLDFYHVDMIRAVATSAVREARNTDMFLDRIAIATSIDIEVIDTMEESRLTVAPLSQAISSILTDDKYNILTA
ncbi:MAG: hypothetical protein JW860_04280, partial [Sedimentisphaerales bacterium]|nr:hypothetical protein [Sedimentisphaerales bacterium]